MIKRKEIPFPAETPLGRFQSAIRKCWSRETAVPNCQAEWSEENPAWGQCAATTVVLSDYFPGGKYLKSTASFHYAYELDGEIVDMTLEQFPEDAVIVFDTTNTREGLLNSDGAKDALMPERVGILRERIEKILGTPEEFWR